MVDQLDGGGTEGEEHGQEDALNVVPLPLGQAAIYIQCPLKWTVSRDGFGF